MKSNGCFKMQEEILADGLHQHQHTAVDFAGVERAVGATCPEPPPQEKEPQLCSGPPHPVPFHHGALLENYCLHG